MRTARIGALLVVAMAAGSSAAGAQRTAQPRSLPRITTGATPRAATPAPRPPGMGTAVVPLGGPGIQRGDGTLPRIVTPPGRPGTVYDPRHGGRFDPRFDGRDRRYDPRYDPRTRTRGGTFGTRSRTTFGTAITRRPFSRGIVRAGCGFGCACGLRGCRPVTFIGFPIGFVVALPFAYESYYESHVSYSTPSIDPGDPEPSVQQPAAGKVIIVGAGSAPGSDALTVETIADSVRLTWLASGKPAREVRLFLTDSAQRQLATRSASPANPRATFEIATLSAPVAFVGVTIVYTDGVSSTTVVPYRREER